MSKGPNGQHRPADVISCAIMVGRIATGEIEDTRIIKSNRVKRGRAGAKGRAESLTKQERSRIAKKAAAARWR